MIYAIAIVIIEALIHWYVIERMHKDPKDNDGLMVIRTIAYIGLAAFLAGVSYHWTLDYIISLFVCVGLLVGVRWALFDYALNLMRGKPLYYLGNETIDDKIERKFNGLHLLILKIVVLIAAFITIEL